MKDLKHIKRFNESEENLNISDVSDSLIGKIVKFNGEDCEIIHRLDDKVILRSINKHIKLKGFDPVHSFYKANLSELNYH
jgi:hypothetical protein